jgi:HK97 family phage prohead protease
MPDLQHREFQIRDVNTDLREVSGIAVPYGQRSNGEMFAPESVQPAENVMLFWRHESPIGKIIDHKHTADGWEIRARISETPLGDEAYTLVRDGVIDKFSVGFFPTDSFIEKDGTVVVTAADVREVSLVPLPWYDGAQLTEVRESAPLTQEEEEMSEIDIQASQDLAEVREAVEMLQREVALVQVREPEAPIADKRSAGELVKAIASGDETAIRTYTGATTADSVVLDAWVGDLTRIVEQAAPLTTVFSRGALPATGLNIEYAQLSSASGTVTKQDAQGDDLDYLEVVIDTETAPVYTYGGYSQLTRQAIERSSINYLDHVLRYQAVQAGKALNVALRTKYAAEHAAQITANNDVTLMGNTYGDWLEIMVEAAAKFDNIGLPMTALVVDKDLFIDLAKVQGSDGRPVLLVDGQGVNNIGMLNPVGLSGNLAGLRVVCDTGLASGKSAFVNSAALRVYASSVARLQDENVVNLSKDFSVYMYAAIASETPSAIVPIVID